MMKSAVIVTVYKRYNYIKQALDSILTQTELPDQIIIAADNPNNMQNIINTIKDDHRSAIIKDRLTIVKADYIKLGKCISEAIDRINDNIDIVFFLDDDDIFERNKIEHIKEIFEKNDVVLIHNLQKYIDVNSKEITNSVSMSYELAQPNEEIIINKNNVLYLNNRYPLIGFNHSSMTIKRRVLDKYIDLISDFELALDTVFYFISILEGNVLHIPNKLTYYRMGSGVSSYGNITDYNKFLENEQKIICTQNRFLKDFRRLYEVIYKCKNCKKIIEVEILRKETCLYLLNNYFNCDYKASTSSYTSLLFKCIKCLFNNEISLSEFITHTAKLNLPLIYGKKKSSELILKRRFKRILK